MGRKEKGLECAGAIGPTKKEVVFVIPQAVTARRLLVRDPLGQIMDGVQGSVENSTILYFWTDRAITQILQGMQQPLKLAVWKKLGDTIHSANYPSIQVITDLYDYF